MLKTDFKDGGHPEFTIGIILAIFDVQITPMLLTKFQVNWHFGSGQVQNRFPRWLPWWSSWTFFGTILAVLPTKFAVSWPRGVGGVGF